jgi:hypothetical protein
MFAMVTRGINSARCAYANQHFQWVMKTFPFDLWIVARTKSNIEKERRESDCVPQLWDRQHNGHLYRPF